MTSEYALPKQKTEIIASPTPPLSTDKQKQPISIDSDEDEDKAQDPTQRLPKRQKLRDKTPIEID